MVLVKLHIEWDPDRRFHLVGPATGGRLCRYAYIAFSSSSVAAARTMGQGMRGSENPLGSVIIGTVFPPGSLPLLKKVMNCSSVHCGTTKVRFGPGGGPG